MTAVMRLRLPGTWFELPVVDGVGNDASIRQMVADLIPAGDEGAKARALFRQRIRTMCEKAGEIDARVIYFGKELDSDTPLPVTILVFEPQELRMSPAIGEDPEEVLGILRMGFDPDIELTDVEGLNFRALRRIIIEDDSSWVLDESEEVDEETAQVLEASKEVAGQTLRVDYWCHIPGTKNLFLVAFYTQLSVIQNLMLELFDAIIQSSGILTDQFDQADLALAAHQKTAEILAALHEPADQTEESADIS